jgi:transposase-like protein
LAIERRMVLPRGGVKPGQFYAEPLSDFDLEEAVGIFTVELYAAVSVHSAPFWRGGRTFGSGLTWIATSMSTPMRRPDTNQFIEVRAERLDGARVGERRRWSDDFKGRPIAASLEPGTNISALARSLDITPSQLFGWRRAAVVRAGKIAGEASGEPCAAKTRWRMRRHHRRCTDEAACILLLPAAFGHALVANGALLE